MNARLGGVAKRLRVGLSAPTQSPFSLAVCIGGGASQQPGAGQARAENSFACLFTLRPFLGILPLPRIQISRQAFYGAQV